MTPLTLCLALAFTPADDPKSAACACAVVAARCRALDAACTAQARDHGADHGVTMRRLYRGACGKALRCHERHAARCTVLASLPLPDRPAWSIWRALGVRHAPADPIRAGKR